MFSKKQASRKQVSSIALAVAASLGAAALLRANTQTFVWTDVGLSNDWADAADWAPTGVPDNGNLGISDFNVIIPDAFGPCTAKADFTVDSVSVNTGGTLDIGIGGSAGSVVGDFTDNGTVVINRSDSGLTFANNLGGSGQLTVTGGGTVTFTGVNSFSGQMTINAATTAVLGSSDAANLLGSDVVNGKLDIGGQSPAFGVLSGSGKVDNVSAGGAETLFVGYSDLTSTFAGVIANTSGVVSLSKEGGGVLNLAGVSTYSGTTTIDIDGGAIHFTASNNILHTQPITELSADGIILGNNVALANPIQFSVGANEFVQVDPGASATLSGPVTMLGNGGDQYRLGFPNSTGTLTVTGINAVGSSADPTTFPSSLTAGALAFITEGNINFAGTGGLYCNPGTGSLGLGRAGIGLNLSIKGTSTLTSFGTGGVSFGSSFADPSVNVTIQDRASMNLGTGVVNLASQTSAFTNTLNLNGGTVTTGGFTVTATPATLNTSSLTVNFNGGVIVAGAASANFLPVSSSASIHLDIKDGGLLFDTNGFAVMNNSPLTLASAGSGSGAYPDGGLTKLGSGDLIFGPQAGATKGAAYQGPTNVVGGLLDLNSGAQVASTAYLQVNPGGAVGSESGSTQDSVFFHLLANSVFVQFGGFAVAPADSAAAVNLDFSGNLPLEFPGYNVLAGYGNVLNMTAIPNTEGSTSSLAGMSVAALSGVGLSGTGAAASAVAYTGSITPGKNGGQITYQLGGGGTLQLGTVLSGVNSTPAHGGIGNGTPLVDFGGKSGVLAENGGAVMLTTTNTYTGPTTINGVVVQAIPAADLPAGSTAATTLEQTILAVQFLGDSNISTEGSSLGKADPTQAGNLVINGGILKYIGSGDTSNRLFTIGAMGATLDGSGVGPAAAVNFQNTGSEGISTITAPVALNLTGTYGADAPGSATTVNVLKGMLANGAFKLSLVKSGAGAWEVSNISNTYTGGTTINAGVLQLGGSGTVLGGTVAPLVVNTGGMLDLNGNNLSVGALSGSGTIDDVSGGGSATLTTGNGNTTGTFSGNIMNTTGTVSLVNAAGTLVLTGANTYRGTTKISGGTLAVDAPAALPAGTQVIDNSTLLVNAGTSDAPVVLGATGKPGIVGAGTLTVGQVSGATGYTQLASGSGASTVSVVTINSGSTLDITNNSLVINYGIAANDPRTAIRADLQSAYAGGVWTGTGLTSSAVTAQVANTIMNGTGGVWDIGYADGSKDVNQTVAVGNQLVIRPALVGDANLDGSVTFIDLGIVAQNLGAINSDWEHGDFNYDGTTNFLDIGLLAQNLSKNILNTPLSEMVPDPSAALTAQWNLAVAEIQSNSVTQPADLPEPGMVGLLAIVAGGLLARRRKVGGSFRRGCRAGSDAF